MILIVLYPYLIDIHILRPTLLRVDGFDPLLELQQRLVVLPKAVIHVAGDAMTVASIASTVVALIALFVLVDEVVRLLGRLRPLLWDRLSVVQVGVIVESSLCRHLIHAFTRLHQRIHSVCSTTPLSVSTDVFLENFLFAASTHINLSNRLHLRQFSIVQILRQLPLDSLPSILQVQLASLPVIQCRSIRLVSLRFIVKSMWLDIMRLHEISIANSTAIGILSSIIFRAGALVEFPKGRVRQRSCIGNLIFYIFLDRFLLQPIQLTLNLRGLATLAFLFSRISPAILPICTRT